MHVSHEFIRLRGSDFTNGIALCRVSLFFGCLWGPQKALKNGTTRKRRFPGLPQLRKKSSFVPSCLKAFLLFFFSIGSSARTQYILAVVPG